MNALRITLYLCLILLPSTVHAQNGWEKVTDDNPWAPRTGEAIVEHDGRLWVFGGARFGEQQCIDDVWSSGDGVHWQRVLEHAPWGPRTGLAAVSFRGKLWVSGGYDCDRSYAGDLWESSDGVAWTRMPEPVWMGRNGHALIVFQDKLWVLAGGLGDFQLHGDIWWTEDGTTWTQKTGVAPWGKRFEFACFVHNDRLWVMGGRGLNGVALNDVWSTADGTNWTSMTQAAEWSPRVGPAGLSHAGKLWIFGGSDDRITDHHNDIWTSDDGATWTRAMEAAPWRHDYGYKVMPFQSNIWLLGGNDLRGQGTRIWKSADGIEWVDALGERWSQEKMQTTVEHDGAIWVIGGRSRDKDTRTVWKSQDGRTWEAVPGETPWTYLLGAAAVSFRGRLWVIGGTDLRAREPWIFWTETGESWNKAPTPPWPARWNHSVSIYDDKLWLIGGEGTAQDAQTFDDVWFSEDGIAWTEAVGRDGKGLRQIGTRHRHDTAAFNGKLWLVGGLDAEYQSTSDIWWTENGSDWTRVDAASPLPKLHSHRLIVHAGKMWLLGGVGQGGVTNQPKNIWITDNGMDWSSSADPVPWLPRQNMGVVLLGDRIWILGGASINVDYTDVWAMTSSDIRVTQATVAKPVVPEAVTATIVGSSRSDDEDYADPVPIVFDDRIGLSMVGNFLWSHNGIVWERTPIRAPRLPNEEYPSHFSQHPVVHAGHIWFTTNGGYGTGSVWRSSNGTDFEPIMSRSPWEMFDSWFVSFNDQLWLIGGKRHTQFSNRPDDVSEVWASADGGVWKLVTAQPPWHGRTGYVQYLYKDRLWIIGGYDKNGRRYDDAWVSADGKEWIQHTNETGSLWPTADRFSVFVANEHLWLFGNRPDGFTSVWRSTDGEHWEAFSESVQLPENHTFNGVHFQGRLWVTAKSVYDDPPMPGRGLQLWSVSDAKDWKKHSLVDR